MKTHHNTYQRTNTYGKPMNILINKILSIGIIEHGTFTLKSGLQSNTYIDLRKLYSYPMIMTDISHELSKLIDITDDYYIVGIPTGGVPYACHISTIINKPMLYVREEPKSHGKKQIIEGDIKFGKNIILIEDVISTGSSIVKFIDILESEGFHIVQILCIMNRNLGGVEKLTNDGYNIKSLFNVDQLTNHKTIPNSLTNCKDTVNPIVHKLINIMEDKKTNITLSIDTTANPNEILNIVDRIGMYVCAIKLHCDCIDFTTMYPNNFFDKLNELKHKYSFLVIEDRKYADIPYISLKQFEAIRRKVDIITMHGIIGEELVRAFDDYDKYNEIGVLLVHMLSSKDNLIDRTYSNNVKELATKYQNIIGFVSQEKVLDNYLTFTPGINIDINKKSDNIGQCYKEPSNENSDVFIVGRGILESDDIIKTTIQYRNACWKN